MARGYPEVNRRAQKMAVQARSQRAELKRGVKAGKIDAFALWRGASSESKWEPVFVRMKVPEALRMVPGIGKVTVRDVLVERRISEDMRVEGLSFEYRAVLADLLYAATHGGDTPMDAERAL